MAFFAADKRAQDLAQLQLKSNPDDPNALFAMALSVGMQADYASLIDKQQLDSLKKIREADCTPRNCWRLLQTPQTPILAWARRITSLEVCRESRSSSSASLESTGDKKVGIQQLEIAADRGRYLRPFAKILLAMAALREKKPEVARSQLTELVAEFPENPLFVSELGKVKDIRGALIDPQ